MPQRHKAHARKMRQRRAAINRGAPGDIRPYGPGKYDTILDSYVYEELALDQSWSEWTGESDGPGSYSLIHLGKNAAAAIEGAVARGNDEPLTTAEKNLIRGSKGAITREGNEGFVSVEYYASNASLDKAWAEVQEHVDNFYDDEDEQVVDEEEEE